MNNVGYELEAMEHFYGDGEFDFVMIDQLVGYAKYDQDDKPFCKSDEQIINDAILVARYLTGSGDFEPWTWRRSQAEHGEYSPYPGGIEQFCKDALADYHAHGLIFFDDHYMKYMLKKVNVGTPPPEHIPEEIVKIFQPA